MKREYHNAIFDEIIIFGQETNDALHEAIDCCGCAERFELLFGLDLSCGDGLFLPDIAEDAELMEKYDGLVCEKSAPRYSDTKKLLDVGRKYRFTITIDDIDSWKIEDCLFYINGQLVN
jgi:hypothetical protein